MTREYGPDKTSLLSVVVPVYNEQEVLPEFHRRLSAVLEQLPAATESVFANDGSTDATGKLLEALHDRDPRVAVVDLSRNFGRRSS